ncbi:hypothetical protein BDW02DRAFT_180526 [Decorospora gaudefroyi]|uniref:Uncharacterized protein n=1 Tax=Decorospora gaudefroyi TaxID=184978 RepID=A0A6A5KIY3_9PLEO|nr:hypothetical protein BDW02DRAFT_180526 [Decorospora gaudefroyi]
MEIPRCVAKPAAPQSAHAIRCTHTHAFASARGSHVHAHCSQAWKHWEHMVGPHAAGPETRPHRSARTDGAVFIQSIQVYATMHVPSAL